MVGLREAGQDIRCAPRRAQLDHRVLRLLEKFSVKNYFLTWKEQRPK